MAVVIDIIGERVAIICEREEFAGLKILMRAGANSADIKDSLGDLTMPARAIFRAVDGAVLEERPSNKKHQPAD